MTAAELREAILLRRAWARVDDLRIYDVVGGVNVEAVKHSDFDESYRGSTLTDALTALLRDLGEDVPSPGDVAREIRHAVGWDEPPGDEEGS